MFFIYAKDYFPKKKFQNSTKNSMYKIEGGGGSECVICDRAIDKIQMRSRSQLSTI